jgi:fluoride exporter
MTRLFLIGFGGFIGSVFRYLISGLGQNLMRSVSFPFGTFLVNFLGCLGIGFLSQLSETRGLFSDRSRSFVFVGLLGGFTTFSAFGNETVNLFREGETFLAVLNGGGQIIICLGAVWVGRVAAYWIWG